MSTTAGGVGIASVGTGTVGTVAPLLSSMAPMEVAWGWVPAGRLPRVRPPADTAPSALAALEDAIRPALERPPCVVQFSGGRDSSLVLAAALRVARREGLPEPVAFTRRFPGFDEAGESDWQERVARHLGIAHWERVDIHDELDLVGPVAGPSLLRHGLLWPPMLHVRALDLRPARGGSMLDGEGGDELLGPGRLAPVRSLAAGRPPRWRALVRAGLAVSPRHVRRPVARRLLERRLEVPWLRPAAWDALRDALAQEEADEPADRRRALLGRLAGDGHRRYTANLAALAARDDVTVVQPLHDARVVAAVGAAGGRLGFTGRTAAMRALFGGLLPDEVLARTSKARFNRAAFHVHSRAFALRWDGSGVDPDLVDADALRRTWSAPEVHAMSFALLQAAWLAAERA